MKNINLYTSVEENAMIIKVKSNEWKPEGFHELLFSTVKGKHIFRIETKALYSFMLCLCENGIQKFKVELEEEDKVKISEIKTIVNLVLSQLR